MSQTAPANMPSALSSPGARRGPEPLRVRGRIVACLVALACLALLGTAAWLSPDADGHGTHEQLGLPPCPWAVSFDRPCATCGMTTAFALATKGRLAAALATQPLGAVLAIGAAGVFWGSVHAAATGSRVGEFAGRALTGKALIVLGVLAGVSWAYKWFTW